MTILDQTPTTGETTVAVCRVHDLVVERGVAALVHGAQVALFRLGDGSVHAIDHRDPFTGVNVLARGLVGTQGDEWYVASPLHKQRFSLTTGQCLTDPAVSVRVHRVHLDDDVVHVTPPS